jgi:hypothetical protein
MRIGLSLQKTIELSMMFNLILIHDLAMILVIFNCNNYLSKEREKERKKERKKELYPRDANDLGS